MLQSSKAIVISKLRYKDHDLIVKCYTREFGVKSYLLKGVLKSKKGKFKAAYFQELTLLQLEANHKNNRSLHYLKDIKISQPYTTVHTNIEKSAIAMFISEVLNTILNEEEQNHSLYDFIETSLIWFDENEEHFNFHYLFLIELTKYLGFYPELPKIDINYFNLESGEFQNHEIGKYCIKEEQLFLFKTLLGIKFDSSKTFAIKSSEKREFLDMILLYFKLHLEGFKTPKSLAVLHEVFH